MLTYNREALVGRAIQSILAQTFTDFEYIIVNNGSCDNSGVIAEEYAARDKRISVIHRKRGSIGSGRNTAMNAARGEYIAFVDDDDWCEPDFLEFLYNLAIENSADVSICGATDKAFDEKLIMNAEEAVIELLWRRRYNMAFPTKLFSQTLFSQISFPEGDKYDDITQMHRLLALANIVVYHGLPKYTFYRHDNNNSAWTTNHELLDAETLDEYLKAYRKRTEWLSELFPNSINDWRYFEWSFMISMVEKIVRLNITSCRSQLKAMIKELYEHREEFLEYGPVLEFEKEWMKLYVKNI